MKFRPKNRGIFRKIARIFSLEKPCYLENRVSGGVPLPIHQIGNFQSQAESKIIYGFDHILHLQKKILFSVRLCGIDVKPSKSVNG